MDCRFNTVRPERADESKDKLSNHHITTGHAEPVEA